MRSKSAVCIVVVLVCAVFTTGAWADVGSLADSSGEFVGQAGSRITADGGIILSTDTSTDGFVHNGTMTINSMGDVYLYDADTAVLSGHMTVDGYLRSSNGITLTSTGSIEGHSATANNLTNQGIVTGTKMTPCT